MVPTRTLLSALALAGGLLQGCATTSAPTIWRDASFQGQFKKVLVAILGAESGVRHGAEDAFVAKFAPGAAVPSYQVVPEGAGIERDREKLRALVAEKGFDGVLVARLVGVDQQLTTTTMPMTATVYGYYGWATTAVYSTTSVDVRRVVRVESRIFDVASERMVYSATTETVDPSSPLQTVNEIVDLVSRSVVEAKLIRGR
jgi:hypothetical protein